MYVKRYRFLSFAQNIGKDLDNKCSQKLIDTTKKSTTDAIKTASKRAIQKRLEATGHLIGNKIAYKIVTASKKELPEEHREVTTHKKIYISLGER